MKNTEDRIEELNKEVSSTQVLFQENEEIRRQTGVIRALFMLGVIAIVIVYIWGMYATAKKRFEQGKMIQIAQQELRYLLPEISKAGKEIINDIAPVYRDVFTKKAEEMKPSLQKQVNVEIEKFNEYLLIKIGPKIVKGFDRIIENQMAIVMKRLPGLNEENSAKILNNVMLASKKQVSNFIAEKILSEHVATLDELGEILRKFDVSDIEVSGHALIYEIRQTLHDLVIEQLKTQVSAL